VALLVRIRFPGLKVRPLDESSGCCLFQSFLQARTRRLVKIKAGRWNRNRLENELLFYKAGVAAEQRCAHRVSSSNIACARKDSTDLATAALPQASPREIAALSEYLTLRTGNLVDLPAVWSQTAVLAKKLLKEKKLSYDQVQALLGPRFAQQNDRIRISHLGVRPDKTKRRPDRATHAT